MSPTANQTSRRRQWTVTVGMIVVLIVWTHPRETVLSAGALVLALCVVTVLWRWHRRVCHRRHSTAARMITILVPPAVDPTGGHMLWSYLAGQLRPAWKRLLLGQPCWAFEYCAGENGLAIRLWVAGVVAPQLVERAIHAAWPGAQIRTSPAESPLPSPPPGSRRIVTGGQLRLARPDVLPIHSQFDADPVRVVLAAMADMGSGEHACVQILARPTTRNPRGTRARRPTSDPRQSLERSAQDRAMAGKRRGHSYRTVIRYAVALTIPAGASLTQTRAARKRTRGRAHGLATSFALYAGHNWYRRHRLRRPAATLANRWFRSGDLMSVSELATIARLPADPTTPGLARAGAKAVASPKGITVPDVDAKPLGFSDTGSPRPVGLRVADARYHLHVVGPTGAGKSTLLAQVILADIEAGRGVVVIDPKGDLITDIRLRLPHGAADKLTVIDPDFRGRPPCLNPLGAGGEDDMVVDNLVSVFRRVYSAFWGPRTDDVMRAACLTLRAHHRVPSLADLPPLLLEPSYRARVITGISDPVLNGFWSWYEQLSDAQRGHVIAPLMNKLRAFLLRPFLRDTLAARSSTVDLGAVLDGGVLLCRVPQGTLGDETARLVGSLVLAQVWQATTARVALPQHQRRDASIVLDECHQFLNLPYPIEDMLAAARGFRVSMTLAHQHLGQLSREVREGISANARNKIIFTANPDDARDLARHTRPVLTEHDLVSLDAYHAAARLMLDDRPAPPFTLRTQPLPALAPEKALATEKERHTPKMPRSTTRSTARTGPKHRIGDPRRPSPVPTRHTTNDHHN